MKEDEGISKAQIFMTIDTGNGVVMASGKGGGGD